MNIYSSLWDDDTEIWGIFANNLKFKDGIKLSDENTFFRGMAIGIHYQT